MKRYADSYAKMFGNMYNDLMDSCVRLENETVIYIWFIHHTILVWEGRQLRKKALKQILSAAFERAAASKIKGVTSQYSKGSNLVSHFNWPNAIAFLNCEGFENSWSSRIWPAEIRRLNELELIRIKLQWNGSTVAKIDHQNKPKWVTDITIKQRLDRFWPTNKNWYSKCSCLSSSKESESHRRRKSGN